jgi:hypothetical protein
MAPVPHRVAAARAHLEECLKAEDSKAADVAALDAKRAELAEAYEAELAGWNGEGDAPAGLLEKQNKIDAIDTELRTHRAKHAQLQAAAKLALTAKLAAERSGAVNGVLSAYDDAASTAREITKAITHLNSLFEQLKQQATRVGRKWPGQGINPINGMLLTPEEAVRFFGQEIWRLTTTPFTRAGETHSRLHFPPGISGEADLTGVRPIAGKSRQEQFPKMADRIVSVRDRAKRILTGEEALGGSLGGTQIWPTIELEPEADDSQPEDSTNAAE